MADIGTSIASLERAATEAFVRRFHHSPTWAASAPGRVNLIGEHTDYNDGFVLPMAINRYAVAVAAPTQPQGVAGTMVALDLGPEEVRIDISLPLAPTPGHWTNHPLGIAAQFISHGLPVPNLDVIITSSVPIGSGLSSSAALGVCFATILEQAVGVTLPPAQKAAWCRAAEHEFVGVPCGIMDQLISVMGRADHALFIDCRDGATTLVPMPPPHRAVAFIADTGVTRALASNEYAMRRSQCEKAVSLIRTAVVDRGWPCRSPVHSLRDVDAALLARAESAMNDVSFRRARHVVSENTRTLRAVEALAAGDLAAVGRLMFESHESLRRDYEVSCPELDALVDLAREWSLVGGQERGVFGSRLTGAGFGGCTITLLRPDVADSFAIHIRRGFAARFGREPETFLTRAVDGARAIRLE